MLQAMEDEMTARHTHLQSVLQIGNDLINAGNFGADKIQDRIDEINQQWETLIDLAAYRKKRLNEAVDFYQVRILTKRCCPSSINITKDLKTLKKVFKKANNFTKCFS